MRTYIRQHRCFISPDNYSLSIWIFEHVETARMPISRFPLSDFEWVNVFETSRLEFMLFASFRFLPSSPWSMCSPQSFSLKITPLCFFGACTLGILLICRFYYKLDVLIGRGPRPVNTPLTQYIMFIRYKHRYIIILYVYI